jgi:uroporphyrinogen-III decarboxylase
MNGEMADFNIRVAAYQLFKEFLMPHYKKVTAVIKKHKVRVLVDSDGDITSMIPWLKEAGIEGVYPLERQAGVDIVKIRREHPGSLMLRGYDKMVMPLGETAMRSEFERILPVMKTGGFIPSVDHQTPPGVSMENYMIYIKLCREYCEKAVK